MYKATAGKFAKVAVGTPDLSKLSLSQFASAGVLTNPGISIFGGVLPSGIIRAGVSIGPPLAIPPLTLPISLEVAGLSVFLGLTTQNGAYVCNGFSIFNGVHVVNGVDIHNGATVVNGPFVAMSATINPQAWKGFDIKHPNKKNHRLRHICVEGPEAAVYVRGKLDGTHIIMLPEYWKGLIDYDSITVNLTPFDRSDNLYVKSISEDSILIGGEHLTKIKCHYQVWASRIDGEPLVVEYEGETPADYPSDSEQFSISGFDYGRDVK